MYDSVSLMLQNSALFGQVWVRGAESKYQIPGGFESGNMTLFRRA